MTTDGLNIERAIYARISASGVNTNIFHLAPEDNAVPPYVTYQRLATRFEPTQTNISQLITALVQVDIWDINNIDLGIKAEAVRRELSGYRSPGGGEGEISACFPENDYRDWETDRKSVV